MAVWIVRILGGLVAFFTFFLILAAQQDESPYARAMLSMLLGVIFLWIALGGALMLLLRRRIRRVVQAMAGDWRTQFVIFCTVMALIEEAITTGMTNLAPVFGVRVGEAYITASANYLDVVLFHSVIVFVPMFLVWGWLLKRWAFTPTAAALLFGITGVISESLAFGEQNPLMIPVWIFIYGLMVYLPAYSLPAERGASKARPQHFLLALILPILGTIPVVLFLLAVHPVSIHFPPIPAG